MILVAQGVLGAFDTLYYHEWRYRLVAHPEQAKVELRLHALRDFIYAVIFLSLPWFAWQGGLAWVLAGLLGAEVTITLTDFIVERRVRKPWGGVANGEVVMHAVMAIIYGAFIATLMPHLWDWAAAPTGWVSHAQPAGGWAWGCGVMGVGVGLSGLRDLGASCGVAVCAWPWRQRGDPQPVCGERALER